ncbi:hypothetical protein D3C73_1515200 [compost metagenome]
MFGTGMHSAACQLSKLFLKAGRKEEAAGWFAAYVEGLLSTGYDYYKGNRFFEKIVLAVNPEGQKVVRKKLLKSLVEEEVSACWRVSRSTSRRLAN